MKNLSESLLDSFDDIAQRSDTTMYLQGCYQKWEMATGGPGLDALGRPLKIGDLVICISAYEPLPAIIIDIKSKKIAASITGDGVDLRDKNGKIPSSEYKASDEFLKISLDILKAIHNLK
jgi:hypothetical protein